ncbi:DUF4279 domain-containing protein [Microbacterium sp. H83]|uniref:DUF4279 domain-containing protein n=1 Tax=Microbacterium sp. H83 TaxID=1827324 RepID=UPI0007F3B9AC|nr:DUF4279 domain-containing protein [Microbacterium sp. H83]OAN40469.1 hypothetical protein A4X16_13120 [Microbacterium sp. H83]
MIQSGLASLVVHSRETVPDAITEILRLEPTTVRPRGTVLRSGRATEHHFWDVSVDPTHNDDDDQTGTGALRALLDRCAPAEGRLASLPADCEARIVWSAYSDSLQGGFVLTAELAARVAALGADVYATAYLDAEDDAEDDEDDAEDDAAGVTSGAGVA